MSTRIKLPKHLPTTRWPESIVLAFDQSLANTGWAKIWLAHSGMVVTARGTFGTAPSDVERKGIPGSLDRSDILFHTALHLIGVEQDAAERQEIPLHVVHELPVSQEWVRRRKPGEGEEEQRRGNNAEMGFMAARAVRDAIIAADLTPCDIDVQRTKKVLTGNGHAPKEDVGEAVKKLFPELGRTNEHVRDAIANGITWAVYNLEWSDE